MLVATKRKGNKCSTVTTEGHGEQAVLFREDA